MVLVTGVSWDLSSPESNSNYGVGDAHNEQWETVHQDDDDDVVPAEKYTHMHAEDSRKETYGTLNLLSFKS